MKSGTKAYFANVLKEIDNIKKFASEEEISMLDFNSLDAESNYSCIYGQMTGSCHSNRGVELIKKCCKTKTAFFSLKDDESIKESPRTHKYNSFSYLEHCITKNPEYNEDIILYLKGEINELNFN